MWLSDGVILLGMMLVTLLVVGLLALLIILVFYLNETVKRPAHENYYNSNISQNVTIIKVDLNLSADRNGNDKEFIHDKKCIRSEMPTTSSSTDTKFLKKKEEKKVDVNRETEAWEKEKKEGEKVKKDEKEFEKEVETVTKEDEEKEQEKVEKEEKRVKEEDEKPEEEEEEEYEEEKPQEDEHEEDEEEEVEEDLEEKPVEEEEEYEEEKPQEDEHEEDEEEEVEKEDLEEKPVEEEEEEDREEEKVEKEGKRVENEKAVEEMMGETKGIKENKDEVMETKAGRKEEEEEMENNRGSENKKETGIEIHVEEEEGEKTRNEDHIKELKIVNSSPTRQVKSDEMGEERTAPLRFEYLKDTRETIDMTTNQNEKWMTMDKNEKEYNSMKQQFVSGKQVFIASTKEVWIEEAHEECFYFVNNDQVVTGKIMEDTTHNIIITDSSRIIIWKEHPPDNIEFRYTCMIFGVCNATCDMFIGNELDTETLILSSDSYSFAAN